MSELLSDIVIQGLKSLAKLEEVDRKRIIRNTAKIALQEYPSPAHRLDQQKDESLIRSAEYSILTLLTIASKHNLEPEKVRTILEELELSKEVSNELSDNYKQHKEDIQRHLAKIGANLPCLKAINWQLASKIRSTGIDNLSAEMVYKISLEGMNPDGERTIITTFECTIEELQNLIGKFKEIERYCLKVADNKV